MRQVVLDLEESLIRQVANAGMGRNDVLKFWFGESDEITPAFIREAAARSLGEGETFYAHNLGLPELREAIAAYCDGLRCDGAAPVGAERIAVTSGGVNALMLAVQAVVNAGDEVVAVTPVWPNLTAQPAIMGARVRCVSLKAVAGRWQLDMGELLAAVLSRKYCWRIAAGPVPGSWLMRCMNACITKNHPMAAHRASSTSPCPTTG
jgi:aspartate/methionine/tyrosine aminotransferase